jgi:uncharacterized tellurite resistance protein B-like protein
MDDLSAVVRRVMVLMMMADRRIQTSEIEMMSDVHERLFSTPLTRYEINQEMDTIQAESRSLDELLEDAAASFDGDQCETILRAAACISISDRTLHRDEKILLIRIGSRLGLPPHRISGLLSSVKGG